MIYLKNRRIEISYQYINGDKYKVITVKPSYKILKTIKRGE